MYNMPIDRYINSHERLLVLLYIHDVLSLLYHNPDLKFVVQSQVDIDKVQVINSQKKS